MSAIEDSVIEWLRRIKVPKSAVLDFLHGGLAFCGVVASLLAAFDCIFSLFVECFQPKKREFHEHALLKSGKFTSMRILENYKSWHSLKEMTKHTKEFWNKFVKLLSFWRVISREKVWTVWTLFEPYFSHRISMIRVLKNSGISRSISAVMQFF